MTIQDKILKLKKDKNAVILAHFYQVPEIQDIADYVGDSLYLAKIGAQVEAETIIVCGVKFMAETAKILSKGKTVLIPRMDAGCPMADMADVSDLKAYREENPDTTIVSYVNTSADVKALTDVCVTSSNALSIVSQLKSDKILFLPDKNLGGYINSQLQDVHMDLWPGFCLTHNQLKASTLLEMKKTYPNAKVLVHPECGKDVVDLGDFVGSTKGILDYAKKSDHKEFIIATEEGIMHPLKQENPDKTFILVSGRMVCKNMKKIGIEDLLTCLENEEEEILLSEETIVKAKEPLTKMLAMS